MGGAGGAGDPGRGDEPPAAPAARHEHGFTNAIVATFLNSNLAVILVLLAAALGMGALLTTPREEEPQIVVPLADVLVAFPGHSAAEVEQLVSAPLERLLYQIDGVEHVYSTSRRDEAVVTVRFFVGEDRERSLVKLFKRLDENTDIVPPEVTGWVVKPVEIDDVPIVTLTLTSGSTDGHGLRRVAEEYRERLSGLADISRAEIIGGAPRVVQVLLDTERLPAFGVAPLDVQRALRATSVAQTAGEFRTRDGVVAVGGGRLFGSARELVSVVVGVAGGRPVLLGDVARVVDGPDEVDGYVRHGWGPARGYEAGVGVPGTLLGGAAPDDGGAGRGPQPAVTIAVAKKKGTNAVRVAEDVLARAAALRDVLVPDDVDVVVTRNSGRTADQRVNDLVEALLVAVLIVIALLTYGLGWREALIVAVAVPVVFGLTLAVNQLFGYTINRVTLFALILSLGLLVDDPIVDVENITRHFAIRGRATRAIVLEAVAEIRPPLVTATLAVIVSFLPMMSITGMMGPYMQPMALNVPIAMVMSMLVAFTITPWLAFHMLRSRYAGAAADGAGGAAHAEESPEELRRTFVYRFFYPLLAPLLRSRRNAAAFLLVTALVTLGAVALAATRHVPLKMLPYDNKDELHLVLDTPEGTTLERTDALVREVEEHLAAVPEAIDFVSYVGLSAPMDFNGMVRHYYLRRGPSVAEVRVNLVGKKSRAAQSHEIARRIRDEVTPIAARHGAVLKVVEPPPGPPVVATVTAEVRGPADMPYAELVRAAGTVRRRLGREPGIVDLDDTSEAVRPRLEFVVDHEKAAMNGIAVADVVATLGTALEGGAAGSLRVPGERQSLAIRVRLPEARRSGAAALASLRVAGRTGELVSLSELGRFEERTEDVAIYRKDLERIAYVFSETEGRPPAEIVLDVQADRAADGENHVSGAAPRELSSRTYLDNGGGIPWSLPPGVTVAFDGEGEWQITLDVFRDLGIAFGIALLGIYVLLVAQTGSFLVPLVVMLAIPLTAPGILPGFWALNAMSLGGAGPVFFTATGMIGMIALSGIVTRDAVILVDFIDLSMERGRSLFDAILESRVVRLRPILLTAGTALLSAAPIVIDPVFSGLAWSLIFGLVASTVFTLFVVPLAYWLFRATPADRAAARDT